jgi:hypothetical protein
LEYVAGATPVGGREISPEVIIVPPTNPDPALTEVTVPPASGALFSMVKLPSWEDTVIPGPAVIFRTPWFTMTGSVGDPFKAIPEPADRELTIASVSVVLISGVSCGLAEWFGIGCSDLRERKNAILQGSAMYMWFYPVAPSKADATVDDTVKGISLNHDAAVCRSNTEGDGERA